MNAVATPTSPTLEELVTKRIEIKRAADRLAADLKAVNAQIVSMLRDPAVTEGTVRRNAGLFSVGVEFAIERKVTDADALKADWDTLPATVQAVFRWKPEVGVAALRLLSADDAKIAAKYYDSKPRSPSVDIKAA